MATNRETFANKMEFPPQTPGPNIFPLNWVNKTLKMEEIWNVSQREYWDPAKLPWKTFNVSSYS